MGVPPSRFRRPDHVFPSARRKCMTTVRAAQAGQGGLVTIACINKATTPLGVDLDKLIAALQACYDQDFVPIWGYPVKLYITTTAKSSDWQLVFFENADQADALGYHDLTVQGQPISKVFVKTTLDDKQLVSVTACHELFEMAIDPVANLWAQASDGTRMRCVMRSKRTRIWSTASPC